MKALLEITSIAGSDMNIPNVQTSTEILEFCDMDSFQRFISQLESYERIGNVEFYRSALVIE